MKIHQKYLIRLLKGLDPLVRGAEVGVYRGQTSERLLQEFSELNLLLIDLWGEWEEDSSYHVNHDTTGRHSKEEWNSIYNEVMTRVEGKGASIYRMLSKEAARRQKDKSLDFVFLDANHTYESVKEDVFAWYPKVRDGGLICGHDYGGKGDRVGVYGVSRAVNEIFGTERLLLPGGLIWGYRV